MLTYLPGRVVEIDSEQLSPAQLTALARWTSGFHEAVAGFWHPGPWRYFPVEHPALICHNDIAPYNACFDGDEVAGVFDWDLAGPSTPRQELAFMAWNCIPLWTDIGPAASARRLELLADGYGGIGPAEILRAVPERIQRMLDFIPAAAAAGDAGMANLLTRGEPGQLPARARRPAAQDPAHRQGTRRVRSWPWLPRSCEFSSETADDICPAVSE